MELSASLMRNGNVVVQRRTSLRACHVDVNVVAHRLTPSRAKLHRRGRWCSTRTISSTITGSFVKRQWKRPGRIVSSDRVVPSHRIGSYRFIWSRLLIADTPSEQFVALLFIACRRSQSVSIHVGRSIVVVNIRLTARLQLLPLARC